MIQNETQHFTATEVTKNNFMNYYRCIKTLNLLSHLFLSEDIPKNIFNQQSKDIIEKIKLLEENLKTFDLKRFHQLWEINGEYESIKIYFNKEKDNNSVTVIARISNKIPELNEAMSQAKTYGDIYNVQSEFITLLRKWKEGQNVPNELLKIIQSMQKLEKEMKDRYERLNTNLEPLHIQLMQEHNQKFLVQFNRFLNI